MKHADCSQFEGFTVCTSTNADMKKYISVNRTGAIVLRGNACLSAKGQSKFV